MVQYLSLLRISLLALPYCTLTSLMPGVKNFCRTGLLCVVLYIQNIATILCYKHFMHVKLCICTVCVCMYVINIQGIKTVVLYNQNFATIFCYIHLKGHSNAMDFSSFWYKSVRHRSLTHMLSPFRFWLWIRGDIHNRKSTPRIGDCAESARYPWIILVFKTLNKPSETV